MQAEVRHRQGKGGSVPYLFPFSLSSEDGAPTGLTSSYEKSLVTIKRTVNGHQ